MHVLAINCGSSSIKWGTFAVGTVAARRAHGRIERMRSHATLHFEARGAEPLDTVAHAPDHDDGVRRIVEWIAARHLPVEAVGHRDEETEVARDTVRALGVASAGDGTP